MSDILKAPWTPEQVDILNEYQAFALSGSAHPYTCDCGESLTAFENGWECEYCHQCHQDWCRTFHFEATHD